jgi:CubicO group peptidase (beta-lactamase class C family)
MRLAHRRAALLVLALLAAGRVAAQEGPYYPPRGTWAVRAPSAVGMDSSALAAAVAHALAHETPFLRDLHEQIRRNVANEPYPDIAGPVRDRGGPAGVVVRHGYLVAQWGDVERVDMTFSVAKSYLGALAGLALDRGLIRDPDEPVAATVTDGGYASAHNAPITWRHTFTQTSEWEGTLWDKPDVADRRRGRDRQLQTPGTFYEYNDVRVNRAALNLLYRFRRPLPEVLRSEIMGPIGASDTWEWHGYRNSWVTIDGRDIQSVSGGGHWGGGVWASTLDHARFGLLFLRRGRWEGRQLLSERAVALLTTGSAVQPTYGWMWWLNPEGRLYPSAPASAFFARGAGGNIIWVDPEHDLVAVVRWMDTASVDEFIRLVLAAVRPE